MFEVKDGRKTIYFTRQSDADNYNDYLQKLIKEDEEIWRLNYGYN